MEHLLPNDHWLSTDDGFALYDLPLSAILLQMGIADTGISQKNPSDVESYYDDWHLYAVKRERTEYSLVKLREQEHDYIPGFSDRDDAGITVSFVPFDLSLLLVLSVPERREQTLPAFVAGFRKVTDLSGQHHSPILQRYFSDAYSKGSYLIAETYLSKIFSLIHGNCIPFPESMNQAPPHVLSGLLDLNHRAGKTVCDLEARCIYVADPVNPTVEERYSVLATHTGNLSMNAFAAEVKFHADALISWHNHIPVAGTKKWYASAIRADMQVETDGWLRKTLFSPYQNETSTLVRRQAEIHGKR